MRTEWFNNRKGLDLVKYVGPDAILKDKYGYVFDSYREWKDVNFATIPGCNVIVMLN